MLSGNAVDIGCKIGVSMGPLARKSSFCPTASINCCGYDGTDAVVDVGR